VALLIAFQSSRASPALPDGEVLARAQQPTVLTPLARASKTLTTRRRCDRLSIADEFLGRAGRPKPSMKKRRDRDPTSGHAQPAGDSMVLGSRSRRSSLDGSSARRPRNHPAMERRSQRRLSSSTSLMPWPSRGKDSWLLKRAPDTSPSGQCRDALLDWNAIRPRHWLLLDGTRISSFPSNQKRSSGSLRAAIGLADMGTPWC